MPRFIPYSTLDALCDLGQTLSPRCSPASAPPLTSPWDSLLLRHSMTHSVTHSTTLVSGPQRSSCGGQSVQEWVT